MRILCVHNYYQQRGGEDAVFETEASLLESRGHEVTREIFSNDSIRSDYSIAQWMKLAANTVWSREAANRIRYSIREARPDVVHFHNTIPLVSPAAYEACQRERVPVVQTLHNYRLLCAKALLIRDNQVCEDCVGRRLGWPGIIHGCYRGSRAATAVVTGWQSAGWLRGIWRNGIDRYIAFSEFGKQKFVEGGIPGGRISIKPNFVYPDPGYDPARTREGLVFIGRLTAEKGIETMLRAWEDDPGLPQLRIIGDGPMTGRVQVASSRAPNITWLGKQDLPAIFDALRSADAMIFPSLWYEGNPRSIIEALATGTPVIASRLGAMPEMITPGHSGFLFEPGSSEDLARTVREFYQAERHALYQGARERYLSTFSVEPNYAQLMQIYEDVISSRSQIA